MKTHIFRWVLAGILLPLAISACTDNALTVYDGEEALSADVSETRFSVFLVDKPGEVEAVWADITQLTLQGEPGKFSLLAEPTGLIEITALIDGELETLVNGAADIPAGKYTKILAAVGDAVLEDKDGNLYVKGEPDLASIGLDPEADTGVLHCPSCSKQGFKVILPGGQFVIEEGEGNGLVLDFDVTQSFGHSAGKSGKWIMKPVIHAAKVKDDDEDGDLEDEVGEGGSAIHGTVVLNVELPMCGDEQRTLEDFIPTATAQNLKDDEENPIVRSGEVDAEGEFEIEHLAPDIYDMGYMEMVELDGYLLTWGADVTPTPVDVGEDDVEGVVYTIHTAACAEVSISFP
jgi:hypothetical protein